MSVSNVHEIMQYLYENNGDKNKCHKNFIIDKFGDREYEDFKRYCCGTNNFANENKTAKLKKIFGIIFLLVGLAIITGYDKKLSSLILDTGFGGTINFEEKLINSVNK